ncbi:MAG: vWA domain-containing protein [Candidatus Thorarchaeota archaeon]
MTESSDVSRALSGVLEFAHEFVTRMRARVDLMAQPSIRQTQSIPKLLSARYFRNGKITHMDFVEVAIFTTSPEDQDIAREVAEDIILGLSSRKRQKPAPETAPPRPSTETPLDAMIAKIRRERELARQLRSDDVATGTEYLEELLSRRGSPQIEAAMEYLTEGDIVLRGMKDDEELREAAARELLGKLGSLTSEDITRAETLGVLDKLTTAPNAAEQLVARAFRGENSLVERFRELAKQDPSTAARALRHLEELDILEQKEHDQLDDILQKSLKDLSEVSDYASELKRIPEDITEHLQDAAQRFPLIDALEFSKQIMESTGQDFAEPLMEAYDSHYDSGASENVDMTQLADAYRNGEYWKSLLRKETDEILDGAESRTSAAEYMQKHLEEMSELRDHLTEDEMREDWSPAMQRLADAAAEHVKSSGQLRETVRISSQLGATPASEVIRKTAEALGMTEDEIQEILAPSYQVIEKLIKEGNSGYDRLHHLMMSADLDYDQLTELANLAAEVGNKDALSAIASINLQSALGRWQGKMMKDRTFQYTGKVTDERADQALDGLISGPATSVIKAWYHHRRKLPKELTQKLREIAKRLLIEMGSRYAKQMMGSSMLGGIQESTTVRPFRIGDDFDMIHLEETMEYLLSQGQSKFDVINYEDFLVTQPYHGHRAFFWALDKSKSMDAPEKLGMLALSVMAGVFGIKKDDFGVVLFDHETHIIKEIQERTISVEDVAEKLLDVEAGGGTGGAHSMRLAIKNLDESRAREKFFFLSSDAFLSDQSECEELAQQMKQRGIKVVLIVPESSYDSESTQALASASRGVIVDIASIEELPRKLLLHTNY